MDPDCMQWSPCSEAKGIPIECSGFHAAWLNAVDSMQGEEMEPYLMQWIPCSMIECSGFMQHYWMQWIPCTLEKCILIEWSGFHAAWCNWYRLNAWIPCSVIECTVFYAALRNSSRVNAVDYMQLGQKNPDWMQWIPCSVIECSGFHAAWLNAFRLMQRIPCSVIECSGFQAAW